MPGEIRYLTLYVLSSCVESVRIFKDAQIKGTLRFTCLAWEVYTNTQNTTNANTIIASPYSTGPGEAHIDWSGQYYIILPRIIIVHLLL